LLRQPERVKKVSVFKPVCAAGTVAAVRQFSIARERPSRTRASESGFVGPASSRTSNFVLGLGLETKIYGLGLKSQVLGLAPSGLGLDVTGLVDKMNKATCAFCVIKITTVCY
jgi:hypothetical protein